MSDQLPSEVVRSGMVLKRRCRDCGEVIVYPEDEYTCPVCGEDRYCEYCVDGHVDDIHSGPREVRSHGGPVGKQVGRAE